MKLDVFQWQEFAPNETFEAGKGVLRVRCSAQSPLYVQSEGFEALAGVGTDFEIQVSDPVSVRFDAPEGARCFIERATNVTAVEPVGEVYTNIDRMTHESGALLEVRRALRQLELERRAALKSIREARPPAPKVIETDPAPAVQSAQTTPLADPTPAPASDA